MNFFNTIFLVISFGLTFTSLNSIIRHLKTKPYLLPNGDAVPLWVHITTGFIGFVWLLTILPGLLWGDNKWLADHVFSIVNSTVDWVRRAWLH